MDNIRNTQKYLQDYCYELGQVEESKKILEKLKFNIQKEEQESVLKFHIKNFNDIKEKINENISPYYWKIIQNVHDPKGYYFGEPIIADYVLALEKDVRNYDE